ncbi:MAG: ATP-dependent helicase [Actinobacteria bacterium]|nr:ATP-dependent helicase [Actinomycetota bacterium]
MNIKINEEIKTTLQQDEILSSSGGIKRIIACAGSGKTFVLTRSIVQVLKKGLCAPEEILAITFTKNAAENMRARIRQQLDKKIDFNSINIYTYNSFGNLIISENSFLMGLGSGYRLINISKSWQILYLIAGNMQFKNIAVPKDTARFLNELLRYINDLKSNLISANELKDYCNKRMEIIRDFSSSALSRQELEIMQYQDELAAVYEKYEEIKDGSNLIDYHDHVFKPYMLFLNNKTVLSKYRNKYKYIFIDEFQDTDVAQACLVSMIYDPAYSSLTIVGDDDQGIYSFRGACVENILNFDKWSCFREQEFKNFYLTTNFRSGANIVKSIERLIGCNDYRFEKKLEPESEDKHSDVFFSSYQNHESEAEGIAENIKTLLSAGFKLKDIAVISRRKNFNLITEALEKNSLTYELISSRSFFYEPEILFLVSWLMLIEDVLNQYHLIYILQSGKYKISDRDIFFLKNFPVFKKCEKDDEEKNNEQKKSKKSSKSFLIDAVYNSKANKNISPESKARLREFIDDLNLYISQASLLNPGGLINLVFENSGLADELRSGFSKTSKQKIKNIETLIKLSSDFELQDNSASLESFILYLKDVAKTEEENPETFEFSNSNSIKIMSIHAAKGLEFKAVFMPALKKNDYFGKNISRIFKIPALLRKDKSVYRDIKSFTSLKSFNMELKKINTEEERRIFYVGCSRAEVFLFLSSSGSHELDQGDKNTKGSALAFLEEIVSGGNVICLNDLGVSYLKNHFNIDTGAFYTSLKNYFVNLYNLENAEPRISGKRIGCDLSDEEQSHYEKILSIAADSVSVPNLKINSKINLLKKENPGFYKAFIEKFALMPLNLKQDLKFIKKTLHHDGYAKPGRRKNIKNNFSLTELIAYLKCPAYYKWRYLYNIPEPQNANAATGLEVHRHIQALTSIRYKEIVNPPLIDDSNITEEQYMCNLKNSAAKENIYNLVQNFYKSSVFEFNDASEIIIEQLFYWNNNGFIINCKTDRIDRIGKKNFRIIDYKASESKYAAKTDSYISQLKAYTCGISAIFNTAPENIINFLLYLKDAEISSMVFSENELLLFKNLAAGAVEKIKAYKFEASLKDSCKKECPYFSLCALEL